MAFRKLPLIIPAENQQTYSGPMHKLMQAAEALEKRGRLRQSPFFPCSPGWTSRSWVAQLCR